MTAINPELLNELNGYRDSTGAAPPVTLESAATEVTPAGGIPGFTEPSPWGSPLNRTPVPSTAPPPGKLPIRRQPVPVNGPGPMPTPTPAPASMPVPFAPSAGPQRLTPEQELPGPAQGPTQGDLMWNALLAMAQWYPWVGWVHVMVYIAANAKGFNPIAPMSVIFGLGTWFLLYVILCSLPPNTARMKAACLLTLPATAILAAAPLPVRAIAYPLSILVIYALAAESLYIPGWQRNAVRFIASTATTWPLLFIALWLF